MKKIILILLALFSIACSQVSNPTNDLHAQLDKINLSKQSEPQDFSGAMDFSGKSKGKAFLLSAIFPGLGERYAGDKLKSEIFMGTEIALWASYFGLMKYRDWREEDMKTYAATNAGASIKGKDSQFFINMGSYEGVDEYNAKKLRQRNLGAIYTDTDKYFWQWASEEEMMKYEDLRISSDRAHNYAMFAIGAILANHVISVIDAVYTVHVKEEHVWSKVNFDAYVGDGYLTPTFNLGLNMNF